MTETKMSLQATRLSAQDTPTTLQWLAVDLESGKVVAEFPDLQCSSLPVLMEEISTTTMRLPYDNIPSNWVSASMPYHTAILLVDYPTVWWGGIIIKRVRERSRGYVELDCATVEHYLDNVYINTRTFTQISQTTILSQLVTTNLLNHQFRLGLEMTPSTTLRDRSYESSQDKTVLSAIQELSNVIGGPEWYTEWRLEADGTYMPYLIVSDSVGNSSVMTSFDSSVMTSFDSSVMTSFAYSEDYSTGYGANKVMASSTAEGGERPESAWQSYDDPDRPIIEYKFTPSTSITQVSTLNEHAQSKLATLQYGSNTVKFDVALLNAPRVGVDWRLGDYILYDVSDDLVQYPDVNMGTMRIIGYELSFSGAWTLTPTLKGNI